MKNQMGSNGRSQDSGSRSKNINFIELFSQFGQMKEDWFNFVDQLTELIQSTGDSLNKDGIKTFLGIEEQLKGVLGVALKNTRKKGTAVKKYAEDNPWQLASVSLAVGLVAGYYLCRRED